MNKILLVSIFALLLTACAEKGDYEKAVLEEMQKEQDVKDYKIDPETMAQCVIDTTELKMPGFFELDPYRRAAYKNYTKMLTLMKASDPKKTLDELRKDFGSPKALADAHSNFTESMMNCYTAVIAQSDQGEAGKETTTGAPTAIPEPTRTVDAPVQQAPSAPAKK